MKEIFLEKKEYAEILERRIRDLKDGYRQNLAIIGDELVGKTSIVFRFLERFYDNYTVISYLEVRPESLKSFARRFIGVLLYNFLINSAIPLKEDLNFLINKSTGYIPKAVKKIKFILSALEKKKKSNIFTDLFSLCETIKEETGKSCVVILDEFHNFENMGIKNLYREWSKLLIVQKNTLYIIISSLKFKTRTILSKNLSLLFGNFQIIQVEPFDIKTSQRYIEEKLGGLNLNAGLKNLIVYFAAGYPFYLNIISESLLKSKEPDLVDVLEDLLFESTGILNQRFSGYLKRFLSSAYSQDCISILHLISNGHNKLKDIAHLLHKPKKEIILRVNYLLEFDLISRSGDFLRINDRVFSFWLKFVYQEKMQSLTFDARNQKILFRDNIQKMVDEFILNAEKTIAERIAELLRLFADEVIQIERKKLRLTQFREIKPVEFNNKNLKEGLLGRSRDSLWIMAFKYDSLTEEDITEFAKECKKYRNKLQRKIIVTLRDIDANARLRALEEKIWTWDLDNINQILDLFYRPRVVV